MLNPKAATAEISTDLKSQTTGVNWASPSTLQPTLFGLRHDQIEAVQARVCEAMIRVFGDVCMG